ncbi:MAG TPA: Na+/H+ antiporter NhaC family protein [Bacillota bacterium]|jgi:uncharacterized ion transporter superfamily protein YfcC|nr:Na+/H+ antiporter NhaC family protein [Bacillota bacterium]HQC48722.1 Na+/H+ antiporter NhaC family protein [Bacillota bacterium]
MNQQSIKIGKRSFILSLSVLLVLMILATVLAYVLPSGSFSREIVDGNERIVAGTFQLVEKPKVPIWRFLTAPFEVFLSDDAAIVGVILIFLLLIGGSFAILLSCGMVARLMDRITQRFHASRYRLLMLVSLFFMLFGSVFGIFEELIIMVPFCIALARRLGWDSMTGLGMSLLSAGLGFGAATINPFTVGVAQQLAGQSAFAAIGLRVLIFVSVYAVLQLFLLRYVKKIEKDPALSTVYKEDQETPVSFDLTYEPGVDRGLKIFGFGLILLPVLLVAGFFIPALSAILFPLIALLFVVLSFGSVLISRVMKFKEAGKAFLGGMGGVAPAILLILMAMSIKLIMTRSLVMDYLLYEASLRFEGLSAVGGLLLLYLMVLVMNFFISSGSAKAFLVLPLVLPLTDFLELHRQVAVQAYLFGDGFSNLLYPTNAALMIGLGLSVVSYPKWLKWTLPLQLVLIALSVGWLLLMHLLGAGLF